MNITDTQTRMAALVRSFPSLRFGPDVRWNTVYIGELLAWSDVCSHGQRCAIQFVMSVWNPGEKWSCGTFDLHDSMGVWDDEHRAAFVAWCQHPWWP